MICPQCGERIAAANHHYCQACGALLGHQTLAPVRYEAERNAVADAGRPLPVWTTAPAARLIMWGAGAVVAVAVVVTLIVVVATMVFAALTALMPLILFIIVMSFGARSHRRRRRWMRL